MYGALEIGGDRQTIEGSLNGIQQRLRSYTNDKLTIVDDMVSTIESFYKTEKHGHEKMKGTLQKSLEHVQNMPCLGSSVIGSAWAAAVKELMEHYAEREANYPNLKHIIVENLRRIRGEKADEYNKVLAYNEEIIKEVVEIERRTLKAKRTYDDACDRPRQKESGIKRFQQKILPKSETDAEILLGDARNLYILQVQQLNFALKFYVEQFLVDLDKLLVCDLFSQIKQTLEGLTYSEYARLHAALQRAVQAAIENEDEQKRHLLPKTYQKYPVHLSNEQNEQINIENRFIPQLAIIYIVATNDARDADQQIQSALDSSVLNAQQNKNSRLDSGKIRLKRMEMHKAMASFIMETLETLVPNIKTAPTIAPRGPRLTGGLKPIITVPKSENNNSNTSNTTNGTPPSNSSIDLNTGEMSSNTSSQTYPYQAIVLYDFESANEDELTVRKNDRIFIQAKFESEGWLVAKSRDGTGLVPESYVKSIPITPPTSTESETTKNSRTNRTKNKKKQRETPNNQSSINSLSTVKDDEMGDFSDD